MPKHTPMRRKDRRITAEEEIRKILDACHVLNLGLADTDRIYVVPVDYSYTLEDGHLTLYFHGAPAGLKYDILTRNPSVGFAIHDGGTVVPAEESACAFTSHYESIIGSGTVTILTDPAEKAACLSAFMKHFSPKDWTIPPAAAAHTAVFRLDVEEFQAKENPRA